MLDWQAMIYIVTWMVSGVAGLFIFMLALKIEYQNGIMFRPLNDPLKLLFYPAFGGIVFVLSVLFLLMILLGKIKYYFVRR